jgi:hypothetical protein
MPCSINVENMCSWTVEYSITVDQIGNILIRIFNSSTWVTVQISHVLTWRGDSHPDGVTIAALSKKLGEKENRLQHWIVFNWNAAEINVYIGYKLKSWTITVLLKPICMLQFPAALDCWTLTQELIKSREITWQIFIEVASGCDKNLAYSWKRASSRFLESIRNWAEEKSTCT